MSLPEVGPTFEVFHGRVSPASALVYARVREFPGGEGCTLIGRVRGPLCEGVRTLPTTVPLHDLGPGPTLLASGVVPDPAFWNLDQPGYYEVDLELRRGGVRVATDRQWLGFRCLGAVGRDLRWQNKRWVLRGVCTREPDLSQLEEYRLQRLALVVTEPSDELLAAASQSGVLVAAEAREAAAETSLLRWARWPAVGLALLPAQEEATGSLLVAPNVLRGQKLSSGAEVPACGRELLLIAADDPRELADYSRRAPLPVVAARRLNERWPVSRLREACDLLQRDLAPWGDFAGYVVDEPA